MKKFSITRPCQKCGVNGQMNKDVEWKSMYNELAVRCRTCGFSETFLPMDAPDEERTGDQTI